MAGDVGKIYDAFGDQEMLWAMTFNSWYVHFKIVLDAIWLLKLILNTCKNWGKWSVKISVSLRKRVLQATCFLFEIHFS